MANYGVALSGSTAKVKAALAGSFADTYTGAVTLTDDPSLTDLAAINTATSGQLTLNDPTMTLSGTVANVKAALAGSFAVKPSGAVSLTDADGTNIAATDLTAIGVATNGNITVPNNINITGNSADITTAVGHVHTFAVGKAPTAALNDAHNVDQLEAINNKLS